MADTFSKKEREKKKEKKKQDKLHKREERKTNNDKGKSLDDMMAYLDEDGNITSVPPSAQPKPKPKPKVENFDEDLDESERTGVLTVFFQDKGYGFIVDEQSKESIFVHMNSFTEAIVLKDKVTFRKERNPKGISAVDVKKAK
ncbi:MAG: cold shock domain-containing protein [Cytophagales bacterium]